MMQLSPASSGLKGAVAAHTTRPPRWTTTPSTKATTTTTTTAPRPAAFLRSHRSPLTTTLAALDPSTPTTALPALGAVLVAALGLGGFRAAGYSSLEYAKAATLSKFVPRGSATPDSRGAKVVLIGASTRDVYYLPKDTLSAIVIGSDVNPSLFDQAGVSAGVPTTGKRVSPAAPWGGPSGFAAAGSLDAVVVLGSALGKMETAKDRALCLREAAKALRPGRPLVLLQALKDDDSSSPLRPLIGPSGGGGAMLASDLEAALEGAGFAYVEWGVELQGTDPHALGVAVTPDEQAAKDGGEDGVASAGKRRRREAASIAEKTKGF
jgi:hypothetical protein